MKHTVTLDIESESYYDEAAKQMAAEIDWEIITDLLVKIGWTKISDVHIDIDQAYQVAEWTAHHKKGKVKNRGTEWVFENPEDAVWFRLKWAK